MIFSIFEIMGSWALNFAEKGGYLGVFILSFLDRALMVIVPAEVVLPLFGFLSGQGKFNFLFVLVLVTMASLLGNMVLYWVAKSRGRWILEKYGKYIFITRHDLDHTGLIFKKHGGKILLLGYLLPAPIRTFIPIPAGVGGVSFYKFVLFTLIGSFPINFLYLYFGREAGRRWRSIISYFDTFQSVILVLLAICVVWYIYKHVRNLHFFHRK